MRRMLLAVTIASSLLTPGVSPFLLDHLGHLLYTISGSTSTSDAGCGFDPNGHCVPKPQTDAGCGFDPNGCPKGS